MSKRLNDPSIFIRRSGPPDSRDVVVFLHGIESHSGWFSRVMTLLATEGVHCLAFDRQGFGQSTGKRGHISAVSACVREINSIRQQVLDGQSSTPPRFHLIGMSWGGLLAAHIARNEPSLWSSVTLIAPAIFTTKMPTPKHLVQSCFRPWLKVDLPIILQDFSLSPEIQVEIERDPYRVTVVSMATLIHTAKLQASMRGGWTDRWRSKATPASKLVPIQVLLSDRDSLIDSKRTATWARRLDIEVAWAYNSAHSLVLDCPKWVANQLTAFIARVSLRPTTTPKTPPKTLVKQNP
jgi:pimeloyl-ACP methyl ester carboxylesterase